MPPIPPLTERLRDEIVELREISEWDIPEILIAYQDDPTLHLRLAQRRPPTGAQLGSQVEMAEAKRSAGTAVSLTLVEPGGNDCRGRLDISQINWERRSAQLSIWVVPQLRGRRLANHALRLAKGWLRDNMGLTELSVTIAVDDDEPQGV